MRISVLRYPMCFLFYHTSEPAVLPYTISKNCFPVKLVSICEGVNNLALYSKLGFLKYLFDVGPPNTFVDLTSTSMARLNITFHFLITNLSVQ